MASLNTLGRAVACLLLSAATPSRDAIAAGPMQTLIDLRTAQIPDVPRLTSDTHHRVVAYAGAAPDASINSLLQGHFAPGSPQQSLYVVQDGGPQAAGPNAARAVLVLLDGDRLIGRYEPASGNFAVAAQDVDGDGIDEVLLRQDDYQMGQAVASLRLVSLKAGLRDLAQFDAAANDGCDGPPVTQKAAASVIRYRKATGALPAFEVQRYEAACQDGAAPMDAAGYRRVSPR